MGIITNDILRFYQRLEEQGNIGDIEPLARLGSPDEMGFPSGVSAEEQLAADGLLETFKKRRCEWAPSSGLPFDLTVGGEHNSTLYRDGSKENADALVAKCRAKGLTVGAVLVAGTYFAIAKMDKRFQ